MPRPTVSLLITDLDNTIYDWLTAFVPAFYAMVREAAPILGVDEQGLLDDLQDVHRQHGDSEHPFALLETAAVQRRFGATSHSEGVQILDGAFHAFNRVRKQNLKLYEGVYDTLAELFRRGVPIVAYTDARVINSLFRLNGLDVKRFFARLYAPTHLAKELDRSILDDEFVRVLPPGDRKPNPQTLVDICADYRVPPSQTLYVGDSLVRDIYMAKQAGVRSAWAKYGTLYEKSLWPQLVRVTHWTNADVEREQKLRDEARGVEPDRSLDKFSDLLDYFDFKAAAAASAARA
jgi:FMN phosphatase YigB (HAD superfamily)